MACTSPLYAWKTKRYTENGKPLLFVSHYPGAPSIIEVNKRYSGDIVPLKLGEFPDGHLEECMEVPCGHCEGCKLDRARVWSERCVLEASFYSSNWFVTLTYSDRHLPKGMAGVKRDLQLFLKRLRKAVGPGVRFFACGERGKIGYRLHAHMILFNCPLKDAYLISRDPYRYFSDTLDFAWRLGIVHIGKVTPESCAYVARYCMKKSPHDDSFITMSRRPGIGCQFYEDNFHRILEHNAVPIPGVGPRKPPRYFKKKAESYGIDFTAQNAKAVAISKAKAETNALMRGMTVEESRDWEREHNKDVSDRLERRRKL